MCNNAELFNRILTLIYDTAQVSQWYPDSHPGPECHKGTCFQYVACEDKIVILTTCKTKYKVYST